MIDLKEFRKRNKLTQVELAKYLGVLQGFVSQIESGNSKLPDDKLAMLLENPNGWDTSALTKDARHIGDNMTVNASGNGTATIYNRGGEPQAANTAALESKVALLEEKVKYLEMLVGEKDRLIDVLMKK